MGACQCFNQNRHLFRIDIAQKKIKVSQTAVEMDYTTLISSRFSVRSFKKSAIEPEHLSLILQAGRIAPTAGNRQPQRILVIQQPETIRQLSEATPYTFDAPCILVVCADLRNCWKRSSDGFCSNLADTAIVTTQMMLQAWDIGIGSCWVCVFDPVKLREILNIPGYFQIDCLMPIGYPAPNATPGPKHFDRKLLSETVFFESFPVDEEAQTR